jgi:hypothetical protein
MNFDYFAEHNNLYFRYSKKLLATAVIPHFKFSVTRFRTTCKSCLMVAELISRTFCRIA